MKMIKNHDCGLGLGSESMLIKDPDARWCSRLWREFQKLIIISELHPLVFDYIWSYPALLEERRRFVAEHWNVIHPLSIFSFIWRSIMLFVNLALMATATLRFCIIPDFGPYAVFEICDLILFICQMICFLDMIVYFNTGLLQRDPTQIDLNRKNIAKAYFSSFFLPDLVSMVPAAFVMLMINIRTRYDMLIPDLIPFFRFLRIRTVLNDLKTLLRAVTTSHLIYRGIQYLLLLMLTVHCLTCTLYIPACFIYYVYGEIPKGFTGFLATQQNKSRVFTEVSSSERYERAMFVAASAFFSTGFSMYSTYHSSEIIIHLLIMIFGTMFKLYSVIFWLKTYTTLYKSTLRYEELLDQVEKFMRHHQFPAHLMRRLREYYKYTFQEHYYKESVGLGYLLAQLQNEIRLHTHQSLVDKTPALQNLPPSFLGRVLAYLEQEVYMPDDVIYHVGNFATHVYFIATGTMVLYTVKGVEVMHYEDGDMAGGLAIISGCLRRITTLLAIEPTQTYRLSFKHLRELDKVNTELTRRIKLETFKRFQNHKDIINFDEIKFERDFFNLRYKY